nr:transposase (putative), gypsy type [Tanacetum cinerariifolium]
MSAITDIRCVLTQKALDAFCAKFHIPWESGWMSFSKHADNAPGCYMKPIDSLKNWNNHFFWVDDFACPTSFSWHTAKHVTRDPDPVASDFNAQDYATLIAHPSPF